MSFRDKWCLLGTHHSAIARSRYGPAFIPFEWARCQTLRIDEQLNIGVRVFDIRVQGTQKAWISHYFCSDVTLSKCLKIMHKWLEENSREFIIIYLRQDWQQVLDVSLVIDAFAKIDFSFGAPRDSDLSGKILVLVGDEFRDKHPHFYHVDSVFPRASFCDVWRFKSIKEAKQKIHEHLQAGRNYCAGSPGIGTLWIDGSFPPSRQVATSPEMNDWFVKQLDDTDHWCLAKTTQLGCIMVDFVTPELAKALLDRDPWGNKR